MLIGLRILPLVMDNCSISSVDNNVIDSLMQKNLN